MIRIETFRGKKFLVNAMMIERVEALPDTTITMLDGKKIVVANSEHEVVLKIVDYLKSIYQADYKSSLLEKELKIVE